MTLYATVLWLFAAMASLVLGAGVYENLVVHPAWSGKPPESFAYVSRLNLPAFWKPAGALYPLSGLVAFVVALWARSLTVPLTVSSACAVLSIVWTLVYFRPTVERFLLRRGGDTSADRLQAEVRRWVALNWIRMAMVAVSWWGVLSALRRSA